MFEEKSSVQGSNCSYPGGAVKKHRICPGEAVSNSSHPGVHYESHICPGGGGGEPTVQGVPSKIGCVRGSKSRCPGDKNPKKGVQGYKDKTCRP